MEINPNIAPIELQECYMPDEGDDIIMLDIKNNEYYGYFIKSSEYVFMDHDGNQIHNIKQWEYQ